jgi:hypothetical protein
MYAIGAIKQKNHLRDLQVVFSKLLLLGSNQGPHD